ncbi:MAG: hypothetical protein WBF38_08335 [Nitrosotalea sp.]
MKNKITFLKTSGNFGNSDIMRKLIFGSVFAFLFFILPLFVLPVFAQKSLSDGQNSSAEHTEIIKMLNQLQQRQEQKGLNDIPNYIAIPLSIAGGFGIALLIRKYFPSSTEIHLAQNQRVLLEKSVLPMDNALSVLNQALPIHEQYDDYRTFDMWFPLHSEDREQLDELHRDFLQYRDQLSKINSNSVGEIFYNALMKFFDNGQFLITQGYFEPKFFIRTCEGLKVIASYLTELNPELFKNSFEIISYGEIVDLTEF